MKNPLREAIDAGRFVKAPGCYDALSARMAELHGFDAVYMSGLATTASLLARPDLELLGMTEMVRQAGLIVSAVSIPVIADADTGYGGLGSVERKHLAYEGWIDQIEHYPKLKRQSCQSEDHPMLFFCHKLTSFQQCAEVLDRCSHGCVCQYMAPQSYQASESSLMIRGTGKIAK